MKNRADVQRPFCYARAQARQAITEYIERFSNQHRIQARRNDLSPVAYTRRYVSDKRAA
ncbi:IS3 family transposase [Pandoraea oxalativorans]|uniref:IS3 family transposase n=1 Tax=Pandoraea oxalativorans TaxID=573737 RepID=UPI000A05611A